MIAAGLLVAGLTLVPATSVAEDLRQGLVPDGAPPHMFLVYTGDVIGYIDPCG